jgi:putative ABC transport system substrate-binding protein
MDALTEKLGDKVSFDEHNASGDPATCAVICNQFVSPASSHHGHARRL